MALTGPLTGVRIIDLSIAHSGPFGSQILADLGAEVLKIEPPSIGELARDLVPKLKGEGHYVLALNRGKKSVALDLYTELGGEALRDLLRVSDVIYDNFRPGVLERLGIDYNSVRKINPTIISCSITGFSSSGPYAQLPSYDDIAQGISGMASLYREAGRKQRRSPLAIADISSGMFAAMGVMAALYERRCTGKGSRVEVNQIDSCLALMATHFQYYFVSGKVPRPRGSRHPTVPLLGFFQTKDGYISLGPSWPRICRALNLEHLIDDPRLATPESRLKHRRLLEDTVETALRQMDSETCLAILQAEDIPAGPLNTLDRAVDDPQVRHNRAVKILRHPTLGMIRTVASPIRMPDNILGDPEPPPSLGQHTEEVLTQLLGYSRDQIDRLKQEETQHRQQLPAHVRRRR